MKNNQMNEAISDLNNYIKTIKYTKEPFYRYIVPSNWIKRIIEAHKE
jgi:hypothetical protein